tara:strand:- start:56 stop:259 length:204 start_codon:yes stop_codon:yes gene_type:complete
MSCTTNIDLTIGLHDAAAVRAALFQMTAQDSYEFPGTRTQAIRRVIVALDEKIEAAVDAAVVADAES